jgi:dipeptidyl aminopeptidase/acylaminoacyl peptidase
VTTVVGGDRIVDGFSLGRDGRTVAFSASWLTDPHEVYVTSSSGRAEPRRVSAANDEARRLLRFPEVRRVSHTAPDGYEIESFLCLPPGAARSLPLVMDVHGGPHGSHPLPTMPLAASFLTGRGFAVLLPNPRGSSSYGREFLRANHQDWGGKDYEDLMGAVDAVVASGVADAKRLYVQGYSYGGYMSAWIIGQTDRFRAAAVGAPVIDMVSMEGTCDVPGFVTYEIAGPAWESPELLRARSPLAHLGNVTTPTLINHWEGDLRCPIGQADQLFHALLTRGVETVFLRYPGGAHGLRTPSQVADRLERIGDWFASH